MWTEDLGGLVPFSVRGPDRRRTGGCSRKNRSSSAEAMALAPRWPAAASSTAQN
jgi:hypothetical protein